MLACTKNHELSLPDCRFMRYFDSGEERHLVSVINNLSEPFRLYDGQLRFDLI